MQTPGNCLEQEIRFQPSDCRCPTRSFSLCCAALPPAPPTPPLAESLYLHAPGFSRWLDHPVKRSRLAVRNPPPEPPGLLAEDSPGRSVAIECKTRADMCPL